MIEVSCSSRRISISRDGVLLLVVVVEPSRPDSLTTAGLLPSFPLSHSRPHLPATHPVQSSQSQAGQAFDLCRSCSIPPRSNFFLFSSNPSSSITSSFFFLSHPPLHSALFLSLAVSQRAIHESHTSSIMLSSRQLARVGSLVSASPAVISPRIKTPKHVTILFHHQSNQLSIWTMN